MKYFNWVSVGFFLGFLIVFTTDIAVDILDHGPSQRAIISLVISIIGLASAVALVAIKNHKNGIKVDHEQDL